MHFLCLIVFYSIRFCSSLELVPSRALPEGVALAATFWWIFNLVFSSTLSNL